MGLIPNEDYIIATKAKNSVIISLNKEGYNPLEILNIILDGNSNGSEITFFIYNKKNGPRTAELKIEKNENSDKFTLGCDVAYGALHEFPLEKDPNESIKIKEEEKEEIKDDNENNNTNGDEGKANEVIIKNDDIQDKNVMNKLEENNKDVIEEDII